MSFRKRANGTYKILNSGLDTSIKLFGICHLFSSSLGNGIRFCLTLTAHSHKYAHAGCSGRKEKADLSKTLHREGVTHSKQCTPLGPYRRPMPRVLGGSLRGKRFIMDEVLLYRNTQAGTLQVPLPSDEETSQKVSKTFLVKTVHAPRTLH